jgi:hypothetical protein
VICRNCGTEIADKALICYRCGTATTEAKFKPPPMPRRSSAIRSIVLVLVLLLAVALIMYGERVSSGAVPRALTVTIAVVAAILLVVRMIARRRR